MKFYILAYSIKVGGGKILLDSLLKNLDPKIEFILFLHPSITIEPYQVKFTKWVKPGIWSWIKTELDLARLATESDIVLCLGNKPPLFKCKGRVYYFLQNRNLLHKKVLLQVGGIIFSINVLLQKWWIAFCHRSNTQTIVQTPSMARAFNEIFSNFPNPLIKPFNEKITGLKKDMHQTKKWLYVASSETHKNHKNLILAWKGLAKENLFPELTLIFNSEHAPDLVRLVQKINQETKTKITINDPVSYAKMKDIYSDHHVLIYPSWFESFGLPLIEANQYGLDIIAAELDYVRDVVDPKETFDPHSYQSIMRAVKRYLNFPDNKVDITSPGDFLKSLL